jgi:hypothetical protein
MGGMIDAELRPQILSLYESGKGIRSIVRALHSSEARVRRILRENGIDTASRSNHAPPTNKHPYSLLQVMDAKEWSIQSVCERLSVHKGVVQTWRRDGLPWHQADEVAVRFGYLPEELGWIDEEELV